MIPKGARFKKVRGEPEDAHKIGSRGEIIEGIGPVPDGPFAGEYGYFVKFDGDSLFPIFIRGEKIEEEEQ